MKNFFKYFFASFLAFLIALIVGIFILAGTLGSLFSSDKTIEIKPNSVLKITLDKPIMDRAPNNPFDQINISGFSAEGAESLHQILKNIKRAKTDDNIKGIYLHLANISAESATLTEVRNALADFKSEGKFIISFANYYTHGSYYLASIADKLYVNPEGMVTLAGFSAQIMFFKKTLDKLGIDPQVIRHGKYKSAVEPFLGNKMSEANREQISEYLGSMWNELLTKVGESRSIEVSELQRMADEMLIANSEDAVKYNLVDGLRYYDQVIDELKSNVGIGGDTAISFMKINDYTHAPKAPKNKLITKNGKIAVVYAQGEIGNGKGNDTEIGTQNVASALRKAREDKKVKAVVLRVNSPGGSALTSEVILREVQLTAKVKPIIASMGDVAASGGYYISCLADTIVASPNTITGSIGVFGLLFQAQELIEKKIGINVEVVNTAKHADLGSMFRPLTSDERMVIQNSIEEVYNTFIEHVAIGRGMTKEQVNEVGQGRVWSGRDALKLGLVDVLGGLNEAIAIAAEKAKLEDYTLVELPKQKDPIQEFIKQMGGAASIEQLFLNNTNLNPYLEHLKTLTEMQGPQMRLPYDIVIK